LRLGTEEGKADASEDHDDEKNDTLNDKERVVQGKESSSWNFLTHQSHGSGTASIKEMTQQRDPEV
jgi:hypothetical protein